MASAYFLRSETTWCGVSGRRYGCTIHHVASPLTAMAATGVVALAVARKDGIGRRLCAPVSGPLSRRLFDAARKAGASELHTYRLQPGDDARAIAIDLRGNA